MQMDEAAIEKEIEEKVSSWYKSYANGHYSTISECTSTTYISQKRQSINKAQG